MEVNRRGFLAGLVGMGLSVAVFPSLVRDALESDTEKVWIPDEMVVNASRTMCMTFSGRVVGPARIVDIGASGSVDGTISNMALKWASVPEIPILSFTIEPHGMLRWSALFNGDILVPAGDVVFNTNPEVPTAIIYYKGLS